MHAHSRHSTSWDTALWAHIIYQDRRLSGSCLTHTGPGKEAVTVHLKKSNRTQLGVLVGEKPYMANIFHWKIGSRLIEDQRDLGSGGKLILVSSLVGGCKSKEHLRLVLNALRDLNPPAPPVSTSFSLPPKNEFYQKGGEVSLKNTARQNAFLGVVFITIQKTKYYSSALPSEWRQQSPPTASNQQVSPGATHTVQEGCTIHFNWYLKYFTLWNQNYLA